MIQSPILSSRCTDALAGKPFVLSDRFSETDWDEAIEYALAGDVEDLEHMIDLDEQWAGITEAASHDRRVMRGDWSPQDWFDYGTSRAAESFVPGVSL